MTDLRRPLSEREWEVARLIGKGWCYKDIGRKLGISHRTVRAHVNTIVGVIPWDEDDIPAYRRVMAWVNKQEAA